MTAIAGIFTPHNESIIERMLTRMKHRGRGDVPSGGLGLDPEAGGKGDGV